MRYFSFFNAGLTLADVLIAKRVGGKMNLFRLSQTSVPNEPSSGFIKRCAFTLAEVLITLGIIGIVAEMTLPSLINNVQDQQYKTGAKKTFAVLSSAVEQLKFENGGSLNSGHSSSAELLNLLKPYLKYSKECTVVSTDGCMGTNYKYLNGTWTHPSWNPFESGIILSDGSAIATWYYYSPTCSFAYSATMSVCGSFLIDTNGPKKPNQFGVDTFIVFLTNNSLVPAGASGAEGRSTDHTCATYGFSCMQNVLSGINY